MEPRDNINERRGIQRRCHRERRQETRISSDSGDRRHLTRRETDRHIKRL